LNGLIIAVTSFIVLLLVVVRRASVAVPSPKALLRSHQMAELMGKRVVTTHSDSRGRASFVNGIKYR